MPGGTKLVFQFDFNHFKVFLPSNIVSVIGQEASPSTCPSLKQCDHSERAYSGTLFKTESQAIELELKSVSCNPVN
jgi:hypothetical protein